MIRIKGWALILIVLMLGNGIEAAPKNTSKQRSEARRREREARRQERAAEKAKKDPFMPLHNDNKPPPRQANTTTKSSTAKKTVPKWEMIRDIDKRRPEGQLPIIEKEFKLTTGIETEPEVKLTCLVPVDADGKITDGAHDMVFYSPYAGARKALEKRRELRRYANALGMTIYTIEITTDTKFLNDPEKYYCYPQSGWHEVAMRARQMVIDEFKLEKRKLLIVGDSVGGSYAQQIASRYAGEIDAAAFTGGRLFGEAAGNDVNWLIMSIWECPGMEASRALAEEYLALGVNVLQTEAPPVFPGNPSGHLYHHTPSRITFEMMEDYLVGVRDLRKQNQGKVPPAAEWPVRETIFEREMVFPSAAAAATWKIFPHGVRREIARREWFPIVIEPENAATDAKVVLYAHDPGVRNTILEDNICFFASQGFYCLALNPGARIRDYRDLAFYASSQFPQRDIYVIGVGIGGERLAAGVLSSGVRVKEITLLNTDAQDLVDTLNSLKNPIQSREKITVFMDGKVDEIPKNRYGIEVRSFGNKLEFGNQWHQALALGLVDDD